MKYEFGKKITDNCQFKKGKKYVSQSGVLFEFSHIGENGSPYFKDEGQGVSTARENEYNCIGFNKGVNFYEAIEVAPELPAEGLVVRKNTKTIIYRTGQSKGYGFNKDGVYDTGDNWTFGIAPEVWRPATLEEELKFTELLKKECERRGLYEDTKIKECLIHGNDSNVNKGFYGLVETSYTIWNKNGCIFEEGKFAEPLEEENTTLDDKIKELIELGKSKGLKVNVTFE